MIIPLSMTFVLTEWQVRAVVFCKNCSCALCKDCDNMEHISTFMSRHKRVHIDLHCPDSKCPSHPTQYVRYYCACSKVCPCVCLV